MPCSSHHSNGTYRQHDFTLDVDLDCLGGGPDNSGCSINSGCSMQGNSSPPLSTLSLWEEVTMHGPHPWSGVSLSSLEGRVFTKIIWNSPIGVKGLLRCWSFAPLKKLVLTVNPHRERHIQIEFDHRTLLGSCLVELM